jgi:hypothetical protein
MRVRGLCRGLPWRLALSIALMLFTVRCVSSVRGVSKLPLQVEVENPGHLQVAVVETRKRPLTAPELSPFERAGFRWDHMLGFTETDGIGVQFREVQATVRSLAGLTATRTIPLASRVEPRGTTPISVDATLSTSHPEEPENLTGVEALVLLGQDDRGVPVSVVVRIPLE